MDVRNKVVIITGASGGIGRAAAYAFVNAGARVVLAARSKDKIEAIAQELKGAAGVDVTGGSGSTLPTALAVQTDMTDENQVKALFVKTAEVFGRVDILLNNAGQATSGTILTLDLAHYRKVLELNVFGVLYAMRAAVPYMKERGGVIINVSSMVAFLNIPFISHYASTKYAMSNISHTARIEFKPYDIRVVTLYPGMTATDLYTNVLSNEGAPKMPAMKSDSAEFVARKILKAARKEPRDMYMSFSYRFQVIFARLFPGFLDNVIGKGAMKQAGSETR